MYQLVLIRHGESTWNLENRFTGWTDVPLTETGIAQAKAAGQLLRDEGFDFDIAYTSVLKRAFSFFAMVGTNHPNNPVVAPMMPKLHSGSSMSR